MIYFSSFFWLPFVGNVPGKCVIRATCLSFWKHDANWSSEGPTWTLFPGEICYIKAVTNDKASRVVMLPKQPFIKSPLFCPKIGTANEDGREERGLIIRPFCHASKKLNHVEDIISESLTFKSHRHLDKKHKKIYRIWGSFLIFRAFLRIKSNVTNWNRI